jgi:tellurite resistance protein
VFGIVYSALYIRRHSRFATLDIDPEHGFCVLMVLGQVRLLPSYRRVPFFPNWWAFTFSWAAVSNLAIRWLALEHPAGQRTIAAVLTALITAFIGAIAVGSVVVLARRVRA